MPASELGRPLLRIARDAIAAEFGLPAAGISCGANPHREGKDLIQAGAALVQASAALNRAGATFVTLTQEGELRGCVGSLEPLRSLRIDVQRNAVGAAFRDTRFSPLARAEFAITTIEVSLLSPSEPLRAADEDALLAQLRPGVDGLTIEYGYRRATFLPQVWEPLPEPRRFLAELRRKAGLPQGFWHPELNVSRYQVTKWKETERLAVHDHE